MPQYFWSRGVDQYRASEIHVLVANRTYKPNFTRRGIIFCHGVGQSGDGGSGKGGPVGDKILALAAAGYPILSADLCNPTYANANWGNDDMISALDAAFTFLTTTGGAKTDKVGVLTSSMGTTSMNWVRNNLAKVFAMGSMIPVLDTNDIYQNDKGSLRAGIGTAFAVTYPTALPNPSTYQAVNYPASVLTGLQLRLWSATNDPVASPTSQCTSWDGRGANKIVTDLGNVGHDATTVDPQQVLQFFDDNGGRA